MRISSTLRTLTIWLACLALLFNGLLPAMAGGMDVPVVVAPGVVEVCSVDGVKLVDAVTGKMIKLLAGKSAQDKQHMAAHCAYCLPHAGHDVVLPQTLSQPPQSDLAEAAPLLFYQSPHTLFIWTAAQARGPPVVQLS